MTGLGDARAADVRRFVAAWTAAGAAVLAVSAALQAGSGGPAEPAMFLALVGVTILAELIELNFRFSEEATSAFTLVEAGVAASLLLLPGSAAVLATAAAVGTVQALRRRPAVKAVFNLGQMAVATGLGAAVVHVTPPLGPAIAGTPVVGVAAGMAIYGAVNLAALVGLLERLADHPPRETLADQGTLTTAAITGNTAVGILLATLWLTRPDLLPLLLAPAVAVHLAYRGTVRSNALLSRLRAEHERLDRVVLGTSDGIVLLDRGGVVELWNRAMERMTGIPSADAVGSPVAEVLTPAVRRGVRDVEDRWIMREASPARPLHQADAELRHAADGTTRIVRESHTLLFDERGRCIGDVLLVSDVTRQREVERLKGDFVARVSHELRTPLTPIKGFARILHERDTDLTSEQRRDAAAHIVDGADRMTELVEDLLLVTAVDRDEPLAEPRPRRLAEVVAQSVARFREEHPDRQVHLQTGRDTRPALADDRRVRQILAALLDNAARYTPEGTPVEVEVEQVGDDVEIRVIDHGPGVPAASQQAIFERFHRLEDPLRMRTGGVGLGLFLARRLAVAMDGALEVQSRPEQGSTFVLRLPAADPDSAMTSERSGVQRDNGRGGGRRPWTKGSGAVVR